MLFIDLLVCLRSVSFYRKYVKIILSTDFTVKDCIQANNWTTFFCVCISWYKHENGWENSRQLCKPLRVCRECLARVAYNLLRILPPPPTIWVFTVYQAIQTQEKFFLALFNCVNTLACKHTSQPLEVHVVS